MIKVGDHVSVPIGYKGTRRKYGIVQHIGENGALVKYDSKGPRGESGLEWRIRLDMLVKLED